MAVSCKHKLSHTVTGVAILLSLVAMGGCGKSGLDKVPLHGTVTFKGQPIPDGEVRFVPIGETKGPASVGNIVDGQYKVDARGGVPVGKHRVEIRIIGSPPTPVAGQGEVLASGGSNSVGPRIYDSAKSPLEAEISADSDGELDFAIP